VSDFGEAGLRCSYDCAVRALGRVGTADVEK
jgi:hypothetical protein